MKQSDIQRKTPMKRVAFKPSEPKPPKGPKQRKCSVCKIKFTPWSTTQGVCSIPCSEKHAEIIKEKKRIKDAREDRAKTRVQREQAKTYHELASEAQTAFNASMNWRDRYQPCISCGRTSSAKGLRGGKRDCGHYRSVGSAPHLRFNEDNAHSQCKYCNRNLAGNHVSYRKGLIARIGLARVDVLESDNSSPKWSHDDLRAIRDKYRKQLRQAKKEAENG